MCAELSRLRSGYVAIYALGAIGRPRENRTLTARLSCECTTFVLQAQSSDEIAETIFGALPLSYRYHELGYPVGFEPTTTTL